MRSTIFIAVSLCVLVILLTNTVQSSPVQYKNWEEYIKNFQDEEFRYSKENECRHGGEVRNLCEKCAKVTKNEIVYPLCCQRKKGVTSWCKEFLEYRPNEPILSV